MGQSKRKNFTRFSTIFCTMTSVKSGYLLIVTTNTFPIGKWGEVSDAVLKDHDQLQYLLTHELIGKFDAENVQLLKNPSTNEFKEALSALKKECTANDFLVVYMATHVVTVVKGEKEHPKERGYFAFHNSVWGKQNEIAESCISLSYFSTLLNRIQCSKKTVILNYAHQPKHRSALFPSSKSLYPPEDFASQLADKAKCVVIASCAIGARAKDYMAHSEFHIENIEEHEVGVTSSANSMLSVFNFTKRAAEKQKYNKMLGQLMAEWGCKPIPEISKSVRPTKPTATWTRVEGELAVELPDQKERNNYSRRMIYWKTKRTLAKPVNFSLQVYRAHKRRTFCAPYQTTLVDPRESENTIFGRALVNALRGGACKPENKTVSALDLFKYIHPFMQKAVERINLQSAAEYKPPTENDLQASAPPVAVYQTPVMFVPTGMRELAKNPICFKCDPPAAPDKPYIIRIGDNEVMLEWYNPAFDGIPPAKYKVSMKNITRNFNTWADVYYPGEITKTRFLVRNLPMGIACQFRVAAYNNGGWGEYSTATTHVIPGEQHEVLPDELRWKRLRQGGVLAVLDRLELYYYYRTEYETGMRMVLAFGQNSHGFKNTTTTMRVAAFALKALKTYAMDPDIAQYAFTLLGLCLRGVKFERKVRQLCVHNEIASTVSTYLKYFRKHPGVMGGISFLRGGMQKYLPADPEQDLQTLIPPPGEPIDEVEEEDVVLEEEDEEDEEEAGKPEVVSK